MSELEPLAPEDAVTLYLDHRRSEVSEHTLEGHRYRLKAFVEWCEEQEIYNMNDLRGRDLHRFRVDRREDGDLKPVTLRGQLSTLRVLLGFCASIDAVPEGLRSKVLLPSVSADEQASQSKLEPNRGEAILEYLDLYQYAGRDHVVMLLLWRTGMRMGSLRALDVGDYYPDELALDLKHRPETGTPLKNGSEGERMVAVSGRIATVLDDYLAGPRRSVQDEFGRDPLVTTSQGRPSTSTVRSSAYRLTRPCVIGEPCPHDRDPETCESVPTPSASTCPSSRSPHDMRSGAITAHLLDDVPVEIVSERMNVSQSVLGRHYDRRTEREKMEQRRKYLRDN